MNTKLDVLVATHGADGLQRVAAQQLPEVEGVQYIVSWQCPDVTDRSIPEELKRPDMHIFMSDSIGSSKNRNILISKATSPYCLFADNDVTYLPGALQRVIETFDTRPNLDVAQFQYANARKKYPTTEVDLTHNFPKGMPVACIEIAFRRESIQGKVWMNEQFGFATPRACAEDAIFMLDCRRLGLNCRFIPITIMTHEGGAPTGTRPITSPATARGEGAFIRYSYGWLGLPRIPLAVYRNWRAGRAPFFWALRHYTTGFFSL